MGEVRGTILPRTRANRGRKEGPESLIASAQAALGRILGAPGRIQGAKEGITRGSMDRPMPYKGTLVNLWVLANTLDPLKLRGWNVMETVLPPSSVTAK